MNDDSLFHQALAKSATERAAFLDHACAGDADLRRRIQALLQAREAPREGLDMSGEVATTGYEPAEGVGSRIGPYKLLQKLGEGGMGTVFMAEQEAPVKRRVAIKIIKAGMDSAHVIARFEQERQALAMMDHPNIAKVLDAGTIGSEPGRVGGGRPFFVMELVKGVPITKYCDHEHLTPKERLQLFISVCQAVQHAHQKGIIHRDLKPSNVLIALYDGKPVPKVIDFGVAKATATKLTDRTMFTEVGQIVGTLEYMAPEQAELNNLDIDMRADIYSLGVLLYELLTGSTPHSRKQLRNAALDEMLRIIREVEPPKPSTKLSSSEELPSIAANRKLEPKKLSKLMQGDLDWIVMKALEKDRARRYETANGFAMDIQRYLSDEPVIAGPPSASYRLRKFVRRNKGTVLAASLVLLALFIGAVVSIWQAVRATQAAEAERLAKQTAENRLTQIEKGSEILASVFTDLDPQAEEKEDKPLRAILADRLVKAAEQLEGETIGEPLLVAGLQDRLGRSLLHLSMADRAIPLFAKARATRATSLGADHPDTLTSMHDLANGYFEAGKLDQALPLFEETLKLRKATLGADHVDTFRTMNDLALGYLKAGKLDQALPLLEETLKLRKAELGADHLDTLESMSNLASGYRAAGKQDQALPLEAETLALRKAKQGADHYDTLTSMNNLALGYQAAAKLDQALPLFEETLKQRKAKLGINHGHTLASMGNLAGAYQAAGKSDQSLPLFEETFNGMKAKLGADHPDTLTSMNNLALGYQTAGKLDRAVPLFKETLKLRKTKLGADHPHTLASMGNLAGAYQAAGKSDQSLPLFEETFNGMKAKLGADHPDTLTSMNNLALGYQTADKLDQALPLFEQTLKLRKTKLGADHPHTIVSMANLAGAYQAAGKLDQSLPLLEETLNGMKAKLGADHPDTLTSMNNLALGYQTAGKLDRAVPLFEETFKLRKTKLGADHPLTLASMNALALTYAEVGKLDQALPLFQEAAAGIEKSRFQHEYSGWIVNSLIACHQRLKQFDQADAWRRKWLAVVKERAGADSLPYAGELALLSSNLLQQKKWADAEAVLCECLALREKKQPDAWTTFNTQSMLGEARLQQKKYTDAEPLLVNGYEGMRQRAPKIPPQARDLRFKEALERLVQLYESWDKKDEAAKWRKELEAARAGKPVGKP